MMSKWYKPELKKLSAFGIDLSGIMKQTAAPEEQKSNFGGGYVPSYGSFAEYLGTSGQGDLKAIETLRLYKACSPYFNSVNIRAELFSHIDVRVYNTKEKKFVDDHPALELINHPNPAQSKQEFLKAYSIHYDVTGDNYLIMTGQVNKPPLELFAEPPQNVQIRPSEEFGSKGFAGTYIVGGFGGETYRISQAELGGSFRYYDGDDREIWQTKDFNPFASKYNLTGMPKAGPLWLQIQQFISGDVNNYSILQRGGRPSVAWVWKHDTPMTDDQFERFREQVKAYEGAINAGRQVVVDNVEPKTLSSSNNDMEFSNNRKTVKDEIYSVYGIPLAMISADSMTLDNLKTSGLLLWDGSVLPHSDVMFGSLTRAIMPRFGKEGENMIFTYNPNDIAALRERLLEQTIKESALRVLTDNEIRGRIGYEELADGGDSVWKPTTLLPAESDRFTNDNLTSPDQPDPNSKHAAAKEYYIQSLREVTHNGKQVFSEETIQEMAKAQGF